MEGQEWITRSGVKQEKNPHQRFGARIGIVKEIIRCCRGGELASP